MSQVTITTEQVHELIEQLAAMTAAASITPEIVANIFEKMRNLNDQEREKVIAVAEAYIEEIQNTGIPAEKVLMPNESNAAVEFAKRIEFLDLATFDTSQPLPLAKTYIYNSKPVQSVYGTREGGGYYLAFAIGREDNSGYDAYNADVLMFLSERSNPNVFEFDSSFNTGEDSLSEDKASVAMAFGAGLASISRAGLMSSEDKNNINALLTKVFPLVVAIAKSTAGTYEIGSRVTPSIQLNITRRGANVASSADVTPSSGLYDAATKTVTDSEMTSGTKTINVSVVQGGQTEQVSAQWKFMNYIYAGDIGTSTLANATAVKNKIESSWRDSNMSLSDSTTKGSTPLAANHYYLFAVKGSANLVVRDAATNGVISGCTTGTVTIVRVNNSGSDSYSYVIVPASTLSWNFKITNS
jgi:hypothetical protein